MGANKGKERVGSDVNERSSKATTRKTKAKSDISWLKHQLLAYVITMNAVYFVNFILILLFFNVGLFVEANYDINHLKCLGEYYCKNVHWNIISKFQIDFNSIETMTWNLISKYSFCKAAPIADYCYSFLCAHIISE